MRLPLLEYDVVSHCNLTCRNCSHFSPYKPKGEKSVEEVKADMKRLCSKFEIDRFKLCGGEPLLHSNITGVLLAVRQAMGNGTDVVLATNALKLNSMKESFFIALKYLKIELHMSKYPIGIDYEKMDTMLEEKGIHRVWVTKLEFNNFVDPTGSQDGADSFSKCQNRRCPFYDGQYIYSCAYTANVPFINSRFGHKIEQARISIDESPESIRDYIFSPSPTCRFCNVTKPPEPWRLNKVSDKVQ